MNNCSIFALVILMLVGCTTEQYFAGNGAEALIYKENHNFEFKIKNHSETKNNLISLIEEIELLDDSSTYVIDYKNPKNKKLLEEIFNKYDAHIVSPERVKYRRVSSLQSDLKIQVVVTRLKTQQCLPSQIEVQLGQPDCFVESMRMKQVSNKSNLVGE